MIVNDAWGQIRIEQKYEKIINSKEFNDLRNKTQLGLCCNSNAIHTRYQHSIGTYYLACRLVEICKNKFAKILDITKEDEEAIKCMALVHDIGHGCFSHVSEKYLDGTHENRTVAILLDETKELHQAIVNSFGKKVLEKIVNLIKMKEKLKEKGKINNENGLMLIIGKLLSGGIDIDRIDYIFRDSKYVTNEVNDFSSILESIDLENIDDSLEVVFSLDAEFAIAHFFNKRFELYDSLYLNNETKILECIFGKFLEETNTKLTWDTTEIEMNNIFRENISNSNDAIKRYASLLCVRNLDENILLKEINDKNGYEFYKNKLLNEVPELKKYPSCLYEANCNISIYNKNNKIFINKSGLIQDISESSKILNSELTKEKYIIAVDLYLLRRQLEIAKVEENEIEKIIKRVKSATDLEIEQEKKYTFSPEISVNPREEFKLIKKKLNLKDAEYIENYDTYYDDNNILEAYRIAVRKRECKGKIEWTVKKPLADKSSISKREEKNFSSLKEVLYFLQHEWEIPIKKLEEKITLKTFRVKYDLEYYDGIFEVVFDKTIPMLNGEEFEANYMIECELKKGNSCGLYFINEIIKEFNFIEECKFSKKEIALSSIKPKIKINPFDSQIESPEIYKEQIKEFFIGSLELFEKLKYLDIQKQEIRELVNKYGNLKVPIVVTLSGTPRAGKTTCIDNLFEFFKKSDLKTVCLEEPAGLIYQTLKNKEEKKKLLEDRVGFVEQQYDIGKNYIHNNLQNNDVILCDRGIIDTFIWYDMYYQLGMIDEQRYKDYLLRLNQKENYFNQFYALYASSDVSMKRDYLSSLSIEPRTTMNQSNVERYNSSLLRILPIIKSNIDYVELIDTTHCDKMEPSIIIAEDVFLRVRKLYSRK